MLYYLSELTETWKGFNLFRYITFRAIGAAGTALVLSWMLGPTMIRQLQQFRVNQPERTTVAAALQGARRDKSRVPTMGGVLILVTVTLASLLWAIPTNAFLLLTLGTLWFMGLIGFWDDYLKVTRIRPKGLSARRKLGLQLLWVGGVASYLYVEPSTRRLVDAVMAPFFKDPILAPLGLAGAVAFLYLVVAGSSNAVNLTDGLDGLAIGCVSSVAVAYLILTYAAGHARFAAYLMIPYVPGAGELAVFCGALLGASLGFLWYNCHPARVFMGDTGSLALGGAIAMVAVLIQQPLTLALVGFVFVLEALSVLLQVGWFKLSGGKRIFKCAPLHHHFEALEKERAQREGRDIEVVETVITIRFWILAIVFALLGVATLKIR